MKNFCIACGHKIDTRTTSNERFSVHPNSEPRPVLVWRCECCQFFVRHEVDGMTIACGVGSLPTEVPEGTFLVVKSEEL